MRIDSRFSLDLAGFLVSMICALHCAAIPILTIFFSFSFLKALDSPAVDAAIVSMSFLLAILSLLPGYYRKHKDPAALYCVVGGFALIGLSFLELTIVLRTLSAVAGASLVATAHYVNWILLRKHRPVDGTKKIIINRPSLLVVFLVITFFPAVVSYGQQACTFSAIGVIVDESNQPLPGATIVIKENGAGAATDASGRFQLKSLCSGNYTVEIKFIGYVTQRVNFNTSNSDLGTISLKPEERILKEVVVEEKKIDQIDPTSNYAQLSGKTLEATRGKTLGEALQNMTGVTSIQTGPAIFKPVIHGVHSQRILILNNGIRQEGQQWGAEHAPEIDPFIATNVTVIKDAGAIKYGTDALGGVVIVTPADLPTTPGLGGEFHLIGNTNGWGGTTSGTLEGGLNGHDGWGWRVQGTAKKFGDSQAADYNLSNTGFQEFNYSASAGYHEESKGIELFYSHFTTRIGILRGSAVGSADDLAAALDREPPQYTEPFTYDVLQPRQEVSHNLIKLNGHILKGDHRFNFQYGFQHNQREEYDFRKGSLKDVPALAYNLYTHTIDFEWETTRKNSRVSCRGINGMLQDNRKIDGTQNIPFIPNFTNYSAGFFWIEKFSIARWNLQAGARYDFRYYDVAGFDYQNQLYKSNLDFHNISGTIGATYAINEQSSFTSNLGSTWRPPNVAELYSLGTHQCAAAIEYGLLLNEKTNEVTDINSINFKTEQALKWVNTYRIQKGRLSAELSGYINYIFNYIYLKPRGVTQNLRGIFPYFRYTQTDASFIGADFSAIYQLTHEFKINSKISLLRAKDETNNDYLIFIPSNRYEVSLRYDRPLKSNWKNLFAEVRVKYVAHQSRAPRVVSVSEINTAKEGGIDLLENDNRNFDFVAAPPAYALLSVSTGISHTMGKSMLDIRLSAENLTNESYREYTNRMRYYADDVGRNVTLAVKLSF